MQIHNDILEELEDAWLGLTKQDIKNHKFINPLDGLGTDKEKSGISPLRVMRNPNYLIYTAKKLLRRDIPPLHAVLLNEMWERFSPMLIGSRGLGKCENGDSIIITNGGFVHLGDLFEENDLVQKPLQAKDEILGEISFRKPKYLWKKGYSDAIKITTSFGYEKTGSLEHPIRIVRNGQIVWEQLQNLRLSDYVVIDRNTNNIWPTNTNNTPRDLGYLFGCLVGDGGYTIRGQITLTSSDKKLAEECSSISEKYLGKPFRKTKRKYRYELSSTKIWDRLFQEYGFVSSVCANKCIPKSIMQSSKETIKAFIQGLMDTDGTCQENELWVEYCSKSKLLSHTLQFLLSRFGIISRVKPRLNKKYNTIYYYLYIFGEQCKIFYNEIGFRLERKNNRLKNLLSKNTNTNKDILPHELVLEKLLKLRDSFDTKILFFGRGYNFERQLISHHRLKNYQLSYKKIKEILIILGRSNVCKNMSEYKELYEIIDKNYYYDKISKIESTKDELYDFYFDDKDHSYLSSGFISHNSTLLATYSILKCALTPPNKIGGPGVQIIITGAGFRQAKQVFEYIEQMYYNSPILQSINTVAKERAISRENDRHVFRLGPNTVTCIPLGDGCVSPSTPMTYVDRIGTIGDNISDSAIAQTKNYIWGQALNGEGKFRLSDEFYYNGFKDTKIVKTKKGLYYEATHNHKMQIIRNLKIIWIRTDEIQCGDKILIDNSIRWHKGNFNLTNEEAYALGLLIGDGCWTDKNKIRFATKDLELVEALNSAFPKEFKIQNDKVHFNMCSREIVANWLKFHRMKLSYTKDKVLPPSILESNKEKMSACLSGIFDTDGTLQVATKKGGTSICVSLCNTSKRLMEQIHYILLHYGIVATLTSRQRKNTKWSRVYELFITGSDVETFSKEIGFRLKRKKDILEAGLANKIRNVEYDFVPGVKETMLDIAKQYRIAGNEDITYSKIKSRKNINRTYLSKFCKKYRGLDDRIKLLENINNRRVYYDEVVSIENSKSETYDMHVPEDHVYCAGGFCSHNSKVRGLRANIVICDEYNSVDTEIFDTVIQGFAAVSANPMDVVKNKAAKKLADKYNIELNQEEQKSNQIIISGTAGYIFEPFAIAWLRQKKIIESLGRADKLGEIFPDGTPENFNWKDYSIIRVPYTLLPEGFLDEKILMRAQATVHSGTFQNEYGAIFSKDSAGFFKRTLIDSCVASEKHVNSSNWPKWCETPFDARVVGNPDRKHIIAIDPASEVDNFSIIVLELWPEHSRVVYSWVTNKKEFKELCRIGMTQENDFYAYGARKVRQLMSAFPCEHICIDGQGGGIAVIEALHNKNNILPGELPIWPLINPDKPSPTDYETSGPHIIEVCQFANYEWLQGANDGLRLDMESKVLLFPRFDQVSLEVASAMDYERLAKFETENPGIRARPYDTLEDCVFDIEQLKDELTTIIKTRAGTAGRDKWDTPETKLASGKKGRLRKDRYSALLMANMAARKKRINYAVLQASEFGGLITESKGTQSGYYQYAPPDDLKGLEDFYSSL